MEFDLFELWSHMNNLVRGVVIVLTVQAVACIAVAVDRTLLLLSSKRRERQFVREVGEPLGQGEYDEALSVARKHRASPLGSFIFTGLDTFLKRCDAGHSRQKSAELARRALDRAGDTLSARLNRGMNVLASTGSTAPFIGLLGTVLGILNAFKLISDQGSGGLGTIGAAIGEALIVTGYGLLVAIPSVLIFNWISARIAKYETSLANAGGELVDTLEAGNALDTTSSGCEAAPAPVRQTPASLASIA